MAEITKIVVPEGLGNATADDVAEGVTFTSDNGIRQVGTVIIPTINDLTELKYARGGVTIMSFNIDVSIYKQLYVNFRVFNISSSKISSEQEYYKSVVNIEPQTIFTLSNVWNGANSSNIVLAIDENNQLVGTVTGGTGGSAGTQFQIVIVGV